MLSKYYAVPIVGAALTPAIKRPNIFPIEPAKFLDGPGLPRDNITVPNPNISRGLRPEPFVLAKGVDSRKVSTRSFARHSRFLPLDFAIATIAKDVTKYLAS